MKYQATEILTRVYVLLMKKAARIYSAPLLCIKKMCIRDRMDAYLMERAKQEPGSWSADARKWAEKNGIIQGDASGAKQYKSFITREEAAVMLHRAAEL